MIRLTIDLDYNLSESEQIMILAELESHIETEHELEIHESNYEEI